MYSLILPRIIDSEDHRGGARGQCGTDAVVECCVGCCMGEESYKKREGKEGNGQEDYYERRSTQLRGIWGHCQALWDIVGPPARFKN